jgi:hypothetical protein
MKTKIDVFRPAPWLRSGLNMQGFTAMMNLVTMEGRGMFVEGEKGKNPVRYDL